MKKTIGIVGFKRHELSKVKKKYNKFNFIDINDNNFFTKKIININALLVLYEYPVKKNLPIFLKYKFKIFNKLKWVHLTRAGVDECEPYLKSYHFKLTAGKKIQGPNVSEHCLAMLLSISRGLFDQFNCKKYTYRPTEILNKKILVVGLGGIGIEISKKLDMFGAKIDSVDHSFSKKSFIKKNFSLKNLNKIIGNYDIVINSLPLTKVTKNLFDKKIFNSMKKLSIFLSVSRDQTINIKDFKKFLSTNKLFGVAIDNTGSFKMKNKIEYNKKYNFLLTDHLAGVTTDNQRRTKLIYDNIDAYVKNKKINFLVSKQKGY
tara:strand:+ start:8619 stop:9572 length:954 start_codon:yes stop_codon:yes gene_type:complete